MLKRLIGLIAMLPGLQGCSDIKAVDLLNAAIPAVGYSLTENIAYGDDPRQMLDIYHPDTRADDHRLIVFIYGGAWRMGNKDEYEFVGQALSSSGHTVVIPDYRLYPQVIFPDFITDMAAAITSLPDQPSLTDIDTRSIIVMGHSSGAHSAALLTTDPQYLSGSGVFVSGLIGLSGPYDLPLDNNEVTSVFPGAPAQKVKPVQMAGATHPRTLLLHGLSDNRVIPRHTRRFAEVLQQHNVPVTTHLLDKGSHAGLLAGIAAPLRFTNDTLPIILEFLSNR